MKLGLLLELPAQRENIELAARAGSRRVRLGLGARVPQPLGAACARRRRAETDSVELGTSIAWAFGRSPLLTAVTALDLDELSGGRFVLGLGTGTRRMRTDWLGAPGDRPARRLRETVEAIRAGLGGRRSGRGLLRRGAGPPQRPALWPCRAGSPHPSDLSGSGERRDGPHGRSGRRRRRLPPDGDRALHRRGDAARDRRGRPGRRDGPRRTYRSPTGCWSRCRTTRTRRGGREAADRISRDGTNLRPDPRSSRLHGDGGADPRALAQASTWPG